MSGAAEAVDNGQVPEGAGVTSSDFWNIFSRTLDGVRGVKVTGGAGRWQSLP